SDDRGPGMKPMHLSFNEHCLELQSWEEKSQMAALLARCDLGSLILGEEAEQEVEFYSVTVHPQRNGMHHVGIGSGWEGHSLMLEPGKEVLLLGVNREIVAIRVPEGQITARVTCDWLFYQFVALRQPKITLAFDEIGVIALTQEGKEIWRYSKDVIVDWTIEG